MFDLAPYSSEKATCLQRLLSLHDEAQALERDEAACAGGMRWKVVKGNEYLVHDFVDAETGQRRLLSLGARSPKTEGQLADFQRRKANTKERRTRHDERLRAATGAAKAIRLGRLPAHVGDVLRALYASELSPRLVLSGSTAMLAYETQVRAAVPADALAPAGSKPDLDLFVGDERDVDLVETTLLSLDPSFRREGHGARRFSGPVAVDCFTDADRDDIAGGYSSRIGGELMAAFRAEPVETQIVDRAGRLAPGRVLPVGAFHRIKSFRSRLDRMRDEDKRALDAMQAEAAELIEDRLRGAPAETEPEEDDCSEWGPRL